MSELLPWLAGALSQFRVADTIRNNPEIMGESFLSSQRSKGPSCPMQAGVSLALPGRVLLDQNRKCGSSSPNLDRQEWKGAKLAEV